MEQNIDFQKLLREMLEPIIDDCISRAFNKNINELKFEKPVNTEVFDITEAMSYLKFSKGTMYSMTMKREIPHYKVGRRLYFRKEELDAWINRGKVKTQQEISEEADEYLVRRGLKY
jgi:excisionase family DNA binding protein